MKNFTSYFIMAVLMTSTAASAKVKSDQLVLIKEINKDSIRKSE